MALFLLLFGLLCVGDALSTPVDPRQAVCKHHVLESADVDAYAFLAQHDVEPTSILVAGSGRDALKIACALQQAQLVVALTLDEVAYRDLKAAEGAVSSLKVAKGYLSQQRNASRAQSAGSAGLRLRTLELRYHARFDWVFLDESTASRFMGLQALTDGKKRVVVARQSSGDSHFADAAPGTWLRVKAHPSHAILVYI